jgi:hypothetical protein
MVTSWLIFRDLPSIGFACFLMFGLSISAQVLIISRRNWIAFLRAYALGGLFSLMSTWFVSPPHRYYDLKIGHFFIGAVAGCLLAGLMSLKSRGFYDAAPEQDDNSDSDAPTDESSSHEASEGTDRSF